MKKIFLILPALAVLLVFSGAVFCRAANQTPSQQTEESWRTEEKIDRKIHDGLLLSPTEQELAYFEKKHSWGVRRSRAELAHDKALEDVAANIPFLLLIRDDFGVSFLDWVIPIAEKLPSQPVAVIQLLTNIENQYPEQRYIEHICPRTVIEDAIPYSQYKNWMERSILALESFTMKDGKAEKVRKRCLRQIKAELSTAKPW